MKFAVVLAAVVVCSCLSSAGAASLMKSKLLGTPRFVYTPVGPTARIGLFDTTPDRINVPLFDEDGDAYPDMDDTYAPALPYAPALSYAPALPYHEMAAAPYLPPQPYGLMDLDD